jgi:archaemetzincin
MNTLLLLPVGTIESSVLLDLRATIRTRLDIACEILAFRLDTAPSYHPERQQYHSSEILRRMQGFVRPGDWRLLAVTDVDLYIPILKYVFGEAQMAGPCAVVSTHRLRQEFYGLNRDDELMRQRLLKECIHELGHTLELHHCQEYSCVMASSHAVEWIDLREDRFCESCRSQVEEKLKASTADRYF